MLTRLASRAASGGARCLRRPPLMTQQQQQQHARRRTMCSAPPRVDGYNEAMPRGDIFAPIIFGSIYAFAWVFSEEGYVQALAEKVEINTDPTQTQLTPTQFFHHVWPYAAGSLATLFDSVACKFSKTKDFEWLIKDYLNDDTKAPVALSLLTPPAENSPAFVRALFQDRPEALRRVKEIVHIYKTLPREQHDDVVVNAAILMAKVAGMDDLREQGMGVADFAWMVPEGKALMYSQYGIEGLAALWKGDTRAFLCSGSVSKLHELAEGRPLWPDKAESTALNQLLAHRLLCKVHAERGHLLAQAADIDAAIVAEAQAAGSQQPKKTIWQRANIVRGESDLEAAHRTRAIELTYVRRAFQLMTSFQPRDAFVQLHDYSSAITVATAGALGAIYGGARGYGRAWWMDVTPSVRGEIAGVVSRRASLGAMLLVGFFEAAPLLRKKAFEAMGKAEVTDLSDPDALQQLTAVDLAYLGVIAAINFAFPYVLVPVAFNPAQLVVLPASTTINEARKD